jgi:hypothetical protein
MNWELRGTRNSRNYELGINNYEAISNLLTCNP